MQSELIKNNTSKITNTQIIKYDNRYRFFSVNNFVFNNYFLPLVLNHLSNLRSEACVNIFINKAFSLES